MAARWASNQVRGGAVMCASTNAAVIFVSAATDGNDPLTVRIDAACSETVGIDLIEGLEGDEGLRALTGQVESPVLPNIRLDFDGVTYSPWRVANATLGAEEIATRLVHVSAHASRRHLAFELSFDPPERAAFVIELHAEWPAAGLASASLSLHVPYLGLP